MQVANPYQKSPLREATRGSMNSGAVFNGEPFERLRKWIAQLDTAGYIAWVLFVLVMAFYCAVVVSRGVNIFLVNCLPE